MNKKSISRRSFIKGSTGLAGLMMAPGVLKINGARCADLNAQIAYIEEVLLRQTKTSKKLHKKHVQIFAQRFTEEYGQVDYKSIYSGLAGEYRLTRLFVRSASLTA
ncbi:twin-arginine translocation signal domain-containing protein [Zhongshania sp.]|uniref:twin-arginine translocation signal domain-containing protein n=1 Tax=Zhongshania sp. TaxID=1971902 RepID=UPI003563659A